MMTANNAALMAEWSSSVGKSIISVIMSTVLLRFHKKGAQLPRFDVRLHVNLLSLYNSGEIFLLLEKTLRKKSSVLMTISKNYPFLQRIIVIPVPPYNRLW